MGEYYNYLINLGMQPELDKLEINRIKLINSVAFFSTATCLVIGILTIFEGLLVQSVFIFTAGVLFAVTFIFSYYHKHPQGRSYLVSVGSLLIIGLAVNAYRNQLYTDTENILFAFMALSILIFSGPSQHYRYWVLFGIIIYLKFLKAQYSSQVLDLSFYILIQNTTVLAILLYSFLVYFYRAFTSSVKALDESEKTLYNLIDNVSLFVALFNPDGTYKVVNRHYEKALNLKKEQIQGKRAQEVFPQDIANWQSDVVKEAVRTGESIKTKKSFLLPNDSSFVGFGRANPIKNANGDVIAVAGYINDISELENIRQKLEEVNQSKDRVFSIVTHDIRSPLNTFEGILNSTRYQIITSENFAEFIEKLKSEFTPIKETIDDLFRWAKANMEDIEANIIEFDSDKIIKEMIEGSSSLANQKEIKVEIKGECLKLKMDPDHFKIALRNLIQNAIKFSNIGATVTINQYQDTKNLFVTVEDEGIGISSEQIDAIKSGTACNPTTGQQGN
tara:strand:- start:85313 stop:86824 length:1512 start_codon:yes stop_codon:yes gene_type:complete